MYNDIFPCWKSCKLYAGKIVNIILNIKYSYVHDNINNIITINLLNNINMFGLTHIFNYLTSTIQGDPF